MSVKNLNISTQDKIITKHSSHTFDVKHDMKSTDVNILLNRVKTNQKNESRKKLYFSAAASTGLILFGLIIF